MDEGIYNLVMVFDGREYYLNADMAGSCSGPVHLYLSGDTKNTKWYLKRRDGALMGSLELCGQNNKGETVQITAPGPYLCAIQRPDYLRPSLSTFTASAVWAFQKASATEEKYELESRSNVGKFLRRIGAANGLSMDLVVDYRNAPDSKGSDFQFTLKRTSQKE